MILLSVATTAHAQHHIISIGYGKWSSIQTLQGVHAGKDGYSETPIKKYIGPLSVTYRHSFFHDRISFGITAVFEHESGDYQQGNPFNTRGWVPYKYFGTFKRNALTIAPEFVLYYGQGKGIIRPYLCLGIGYGSQDELDAYDPAYYASNYYNGVNHLGPDKEVIRRRQHTDAYFTPIGLSIGRGKLRGFAELGFGYKGVLNAGCTLHL